MDTITLWRITLLGTLSAERGTDVITRFRSQKTGGLLAYLALFPRRVHTREELADLFWPDADPEAGRTNLRSALASLRRQLEPPGVEAGSVLVTRGHSDVFLNRAAFETDVARFERRLEAAAASPERFPLVSEAVALYGGPLLPGRYEDWALTERDRLAGLYLGALRDLARQYETLGDRDRALEAVRRVLTADPLSEEAHLDVLRLLMADGQASAAKRHYAEMERLFDDELGTEPPQEARALLDAAPVRLPPKQDASGQAAASPLPASGRLPGRAAAASPVHLPMTLTRFFGRDTEEAQIAATLRETERVRLLTLTGAGGSGKTRLAIETARALAPDFPGGVWFVPLADTTQADRFFDAVAAALRLPQTTAVPVRDQVIGALRRWGEVGPVLLLLDNFEQIVVDASLFGAEMLASVPALSCLVTSRQRLLIDGEYEMPVAPLPTPSFVERPEELASFPSVQLFVSRAQAARPDFQLTDRNAAAVAQLCRHLEGIPLALELAAAWAQTLSPAQMLERLARRFDLLVSRRRDVPGRHATLRATVEWSYQLLSPELRRFFAGLSVFSGGWTLEAAEDVLAEPRTLEYMAELQDRSLIVRQEMTYGEADSDAPPRFGMLETLREFAAEQVSGEERGRLMRRHFDWYLRLAEEAERHQRSADQARQLRRLEAERGNLRAALEYSFGSEAKERQQDGLRLAASLGWFWFRRSLLREGSEWLRAALAVDGEPEARIRVLNTLAFIVNYQAEHAASFGYCREARTLAETIGHQEHAVYSLFGMGMFRVNFHAPGEDTLEAAEAFLTNAAAEFRRVGDATGDRWLQAHSLFAGALAALFAGELPKSLAHVEEAVALFRETTDTWMNASIGMTLGMVGHMAGDLAAAEAGYRGTVQESLPLGYDSGLYWGVHGLAGVAAQRGQAERGAILFGAAERLAAAIHMDLPVFCLPLHERDVATVRQALGDAARFEAAWAEGRALTLEQAVALALA